MAPESASIAFGVAGVAAAVVSVLWGKKREIEDRCEFLAVVDADMGAAFEDADKVLGDVSTPEVVRQALQVLLAAHMSSHIGRPLADAIFGDDQAKDEPSRQNNPIVDAMRSLGDTNPELERRAHRTTITLIMGLAVVYFGDEMHVMKVEREAARDPVGIWDRLGEVVGREFPPRSDTFIHAQ